MILNIRRRFERSEAIERLERFERKLSDWQKVFLLSTLSTPNHQDLLPNYGWNFPRKTWLQNRLEKIRKEQSHETDR